MRRVLVVAAMAMCILACTSFEAASSDAGTACNEGKATVVLCAQAELESNDRTADDAVRLIVLPTTDDRGPYVPNCMTIRAGQTVTWRGRMAAHPLEPRDGSSPDNPIPKITRSVDEVPVTFPCAGDFNFGCTKHGGAMAGTIRVVQ